MYRAILLVLLSVFSYAETHRVVGESYYHTFSAAHSVLARVKPGDTIVSKTVDSAGFDYQGIRRTKTHGNPLTGAFYVEGAEPGDALKVTIEAFKPSGFGWTANIPGFGLLADDFKEPALTIWKYDATSLEPALFGKNGRVPAKGFSGNSRRW